MMIEVLLVLALETAVSPSTMPTQCPPEEVCYPVDPRDPKPAPPNCFYDEEGNLTCFVADPSGKF